MELLFTEVKGQIVAGEVISKTERSYNLKFICFDSVTTAIRTKSECFTSKAKAERYFK